MASCAQNQANQDEEGGAENGGGGASGSGTQQSSSSNNSGREAAAALAAQQAAAADVAAQAAAANHFARQQLQAQQHAARGIQVGINLSEENIFLLKMFDNFFLIPGRATGDADGSHGGESQADVSNGNEISSKGITSWANAISRWIFHVKTKITNERAGSRKRNDVDKKTQNKNMKE